MNQYEGQNTELKGIRVFNTQNMVFLCNISYHLVGLD